MDGLEVGTGTMHEGFAPAGQDVVMVIAAPGDAAIGREAVALAGARLVGPVGWSALAASLDTQVRIDALLVETRDTPDQLLDAALPRIDRFARDADAAIVVALDRPQIDRVAAHLLGAQRQLLCDASLADRVAALALARARAEPAWFDDAHGSAESERLRRLHEEIARIAETLAQLTRSPVKDPPPPAAVSDAGRGFAAQPREAAPVDPREVRRAIRGRRLRDNYFPTGLFEDPAWDMLLDLFAAELERTRVSVSSLCIAASVAPTTALRWIGKMVEIGLFERHPDPLDRRRAFMALSPVSRQGLTEYFAATAQQRLSIA